MNMWFLMDECSHPLAQSYTATNGVVMCANQRYPETNYASDHVRPGGTEQLEKDYAELFASPSYQAYLKGRM